MLRVWRVLGIGLWVLGCGGGEHSALQPVAAGMRGAAGDGAGGVAAAGGGGNSGTGTGTGTGTGGVSGTGAGGVAGMSLVGGAGASGVSGAGGGSDAGGASGMGAAGAAGAAGGGSASSVTERDGKYVVSMGEVSFEIDPKLGGRMTVCSIGGRNLLTGPDVDSLNFGSTFWPSPQARWSWPPVPEIDSQPYMASLSGDTITLTSAVGVRAKVQVEKRFTPRAGALEVQYTLRNSDSAPAAWAPWEITRVAGGTTFFPQGQRDVSTQLALTKRESIAWYVHDGSKLPMEGQKYSGDGSGGWLAHVAGDVLLLKRWDDVPLEAQAPAPEGEIEIYAAPRYVEVEAQGPYKQLMPGESTSWTVHWYVRRLPADVQPTLGSAALVAFARTLATSAP